MTDFTTARLTPAMDTGGKEVIIEQFKLTDIPKAMDKLGWTESARIMRRWFEGEAYVVDMKIKQGKIPASSLSQEKFYDEIDFEWLYSSTNRIKPYIEQLVVDLTKVVKYNHHIGFLPTSQSPSPGLRLLLTRLGRLGALDDEHHALIYATYDFSNKTAIELEELSQFNYWEVGTHIFEQIFDQLDDIYGTLGGFLIKAAATKIRTFTHQSGYSVIEIDEIGFYVRDTYDFLNSKDEDQPLGYWSSEGVIKPGILDAVIDNDYIDKNETRYFKVTNNNFNQYRETHGKGGDLTVYSSVLRIPTEITIDLRPEEIENYFAGKK